MEFPGVTWATLDECTHELAKPGNLPEPRIKQELLVGLLEGAIPFRLKTPPDGPVEDWTPDDFKEAAFSTGDLVRNPRNPVKPRLEPMARLTAMRWQDYSEEFQKLFLNCFELQREHALAFARRNKKVSTVAEENRCRRWLIDLMQKGPREHPKEHYLGLAQQKFNVTARGFNRRIWPDAIAQTGSDWSDPGRPKS